MKTLSVIALTSLLLLLSSCDKNNSPAAVIDADTQENRPVETPINPDESSAETATEAEIEKNIAVTPTEVPEAPTVLSTEQRYQQFMAADEYLQQEIINNLESSGADVSLMAQLITQNISSDTKQAMLQTLMYGERGEVVYVIYEALRDSDPDVVIAAVDSLRTLDSPDDIPALQTLAAETANEDVRDAANSAIDYLTP